MRATRNHTRCDLCSIEVIQDESEMPDGWATVTIDLAKRDGRVLQLCFKHTSELEGWLASRSKLRPAAPRRPEKMARLAESA